MDEEERMTMHGFEAKKESKNKVFIGVPAYAFSNTVWAINLAMMCCDTPGIDAVVANYTTPIELARDNLVEKFLETDCTHMLFWDNDTLAPRNALNRLLGHDKDIIGGLYFIRGPPYAPTIYYGVHGDDGDYLKGYEGWAETGLKKVDGIGTGFLLIKRKVFETVKAPWFEYKIAIDTKGNIVSFGEDLFFCANAGRAGFEMWVDIAVKCGHLMYDIVSEQTWREYNAIHKKV